MVGEKKKQKTRAQKYCWVFLITSAVNIKKKKKSGRPLVTVYYGYI